MRNAILWLLRMYSYLYHLALCLFLIGVSAMAMLSGRNNLKLGMLPWTGDTLARAVIALGIVGIVCLILAVTGFIRWLFPLWTLVVLGFLVRGYFLTGYSFEGAGEFKFAIWLTAGALLAFLGSLSLFTRRKR